MILCDTAFPVSCLYLLISPLVGGCAVSAVYAKAERGLKGRMATRTTCPEDRQGCPVLCKL